MQKNFLILLLVLSTVTSVWSFDGNRKGFVLGGGLGLSPSVRWEADQYNSFNESKVGIALHAIIGYAWDENNFIAYEENANGIRSTETGTTVNVIQGFSGASWYHYFGNSENQIFSVLGLGVYSFAVEDFKPNLSGSGLLIGGGKEISTHWKIGLYLTLGETSDRMFDYKHRSFNLLVSGIAF